MRIQSLILEFKGLRLVFTSDRVGHSLLWDRGQYGSTFQNSFGKRHFQGLQISLMSVVSLTSASQILESFWNIWSQVSDFPARGPGMYTLS